MGQNQTFSRLLFVDWSKWRWKDWFAPIESSAEVGPAFAIAICHEIRCRDSGVPRVGNVRKNFGGLAILAVRRTLTWSRGECIRVVGIHSDG